MTALALTLAGLAALVLPVARGGLGGGSAPATRLHRATAERAASLPGRRRTVWHPTGVFARIERLRSTGGESPDTALVADLLAACLAAGLPVSTAVRAVAGVTSGRAAEALRRAADALALGAPVGTAWEAARAYPATTELARAACRTARSGSAMAPAVSAVAERARQLAADAAEARAERAGVLIAGPLALCFLPAFLCLGVIPVVVGLATRLDTVT